MKTICLLGIAVFCLVACSHTKLDKDHATTVIRSAKAYPKVYEFEINTVDPISAKRVLDAGLEETGMVTVDRTQKLRDIGQPLVHFTDKAKPYLLRVDSHYKQDQIVKVADMDLGEVTGIQMRDDGKTAIVEYTVVYKNLTPFAKLVHRDFTRSETKRASLTLFDTGWKLDKRR